ncbi:MAG: FGGY family carbohydrate kinase [Kouleothrix sp.]
MPEYLLGIDNGATVSKVVVFDLSGAVVGSAARQAAVCYPRPGWAERPADELWRDTAAAIRAALEASGARPGDIAAIGACGYGNGLYLLDQRGLPLRPGILSMDTRAADVIAGWQARGVLDAVRPAIGQTPYAAQPRRCCAGSSCRACRLRQDRRGAADQRFRDQPAHRRARQRFRRHGRGRPAEPAYARLRARAARVFRHSRGGRRAAAAPRTARSSGEVVGAAARETGLRAGTPVAAGMFDACAGPLGAGAIELGRLCATVGTQGVNALVARAPAKRGPAYSAPAIRSAAG